jgi:cysteine desulfurase
LIYLDYNRTTPVASGVIDAMKPFWATHYLLPDQVHPQANAVSEMLNLAREQVAALVSAESFEIVFTGGGTESNNLAIRGTVDLNDPGHVLVSSIEHDSIEATALALEAFGFDVEHVPCNADGWTDPDDVSFRLRDHTQLVCVQLANPVLGTIQPIAAIADRCKSRGVRLHCDATQSIGKIPVDVTRLGVDTLSISAHKFFGPKGVGALFVRRGLELNPVMFGEPREMGLRPGPENVAGCIGMGAAALMAARCAIEAEVGLRDLRDDLVNRLIAAIHPAPRILAEDAIRLPNTVALEMPGDAARLQQVARDLVLATAQCENPPDEMTRTLQAIGCSAATIGRTLRISLGWTTTRDEVHRAVEILADAWESVRV